MNLRVILEWIGTRCLSLIYFVNSKVVVESGPLMGIEGLIMTVDKRKMRAKIKVKFMGLAKEIDVGIEVLNQFSAENIDGMEQN